MTDVLRLYAWMDLETNGRRLEDETYYEGVPFEVAMVITDSKFNEQARYESLVHVPRGENSYLERTMPDVVFNMHTESGLLQDYSSAITHNIYKIYHFNVDEAMVNIIHSVKNFNVWGSPLPEIELMLAGSGVSHFDSRWIKRYFPMVWSELHGYDSETKPTLDIGVVRRFLQHFVPQYPYPKNEVQGNHRALQDVLSFIEEARLLSVDLSNLNEYAEAWTNGTYEAWLLQKDEPRP